MGWNPITALRDAFSGTPLLHVASDVGSGPVVVLVHGIASSSVTFQNVVPLLEGDHRCISIDLLGFGRSPRPEGCEYRMRDHEAALDRTIRSLGLTEPFVLVGHSMGALIGARYTARRRGRVRRLVLVGPPIYLTPHELSDDRDRFVQDAFLKLYRYLRENQDFTLRNSTIVERLVGIPKAFTLDADSWDPFVKSLEHTIEAQTVISDLAAIRVPVEIVYGSLDEFSSPGGIRIAERMRGVRVTRVWAATHIIMKSLARAVATAVDRPDPA